MKGHKLTLEEVLNLEDGTKVWVEDDDEGDKQVGTINKEDNSLELMEDSWFYLDDLPDGEYVRFYEWIEEPKEIFGSCVNDGLICKITITKNELLSFFERNEIQIGDEYYRDYCDNDFKEKIDKLFEEFS